MVGVEKKAPLVEIGKVPAEIAVGKEYSEKNKDPDYMVVVDKVDVDKKDPADKVAVVEIDILAAKPAYLN